MGINSKKAPPLPAPTEESTTTSELEPTPTDVSKPGDEKSTYSLPEDGTPVTIKTRGKNNKQTSLLIEYSDHPKNGATGAEGDRRPSVRVRVTTPSGKGKDGGGRVAFGGVAPRPWRVEAAEGAMTQGAQAVADRVFANTRPTDDNAFKLPLATRTLAAVIEEARE